MASLNLNVLLLNRGYSPMTVISSKRALEMLYSNIAEVVAVNGKVYSSHTFNSWTELSELKKELNETTGAEDWVRTPNLILEVPRIIKLVHDTKYYLNKGVSLTRKNIFLRDNYTCQYCGTKHKAKSLDLEHVNPRCQGGIDSWENLVCACKKCNRKKKGRTPGQAGMQLIRNPVRPKSLPDFRLAHSRKYISWKNFISEVYWNVELEGA